MFDDTIHVPWGNLNVPLEDSATTMSMIEVGIVKYSNDFKFFSDPKKIWEIQLS